MVALTSSHRYAVCVEELGPRPIPAQLGFPGEDPPRDDISFRLADLPGGRRVVLTNAPEWGAADRDDIPLDCARSTEVPVWSAAAGDVLPEWIPWNTRPAEP